MGTLTSSLSGNMLLPYSTSEVKVCIDVLKK